MPKLEKLIEGAIFNSRWLQVPLYLGLILVLLVLCVKFFMVLVKLMLGMGDLDEAKIVLMVLELVDVVMVANLIVMVVISGYENFVSRLDIDGQGEKLSWFGKLDAGSLKIKLASSIVAISSIHLLKAFLDAAEISNDKLLMLVVIHMTFIVSALMLAYLDKMLGQKTSGGS
jgi:uncharacterized protein (TIGR00645 family)